MSANYRRLISYIYAYEGGEKGRNVGFAKLETRNGQCRIQVSVRKIYMGSQDTGVFLLAGAQEILIGRIFLRNGAGEFRTSVAVNNVAGSDQSIDRCYGLTIHSIDDSWQSYTTIWEDAVAHAAEIELAEAVSELIEAKQMQKIPESIVPEERENLSPASGLELSSEPLPPALSEPLPTLQQPASQPESQSEPLPVLQSELELPPEVQVTPQPEAQPEPKSEVQPEPQDHTQSASPQVLNVQEPTDDVEAVKLWNYLVRSYPKIQAFDYDGGCEILTIKPQDIGLLPREVWTYGNNSFLLHGYYNHRHLILVRLKNPDGTARFLLGVPGHYYSNEKYMAAMFGFPNFVLSKMQPSEDGRFGYWYVDVRLGNQ